MIIVNVCTDTAKISSLYMTVYLANKENSDHSVMFHVVV